MTNYYEILQIDMTATYEEIKKSYQSMALKYHPDKQLQPNIVEKVNNKFMEIDEAWKTLRDHTLRKVYDAELLQQKFNEKPLVHDVLTIDDFSYDEENNEYFYICRCGGVYIAPDDHIETECFISCDECSLVVQLKYKNR